MATSELGVLMLKAPKGLLGLTGEPRIESLIMERTLSASSDTQVPKERPSAPIIRSASRVVLSVRETLGLSWSMLEIKLLNGIFTARSFPPKLVYFEICVEPYSNHCIHQHWSSPAYPERESILISISHNGLVIHPATQDLSILISSFIGDPAQASRRITYSALPHKVAAGR